MKYIVFWLVVNSYISGPSIKEDEYGKMPEHFTVPAIAMQHETREWKIKVFDSKEEADHFMENCPVEVKEIYIYELIKGGKK